MNRVRELLRELETIHDAKNSDYADSKTDPFRNFRMCERVGIPAWLGCFVRMGDKWNRVENLINKAREGRAVAVKDETMRDTLKDLAAYSLILIALLEENDPPS